MMRNSRLLIVLAAAVLLAMPISPSRAAPVDLATMCALAFKSRAVQLATINGTVYPYQWYRTALSKTSVTLTLVVVSPSDSVPYKGFQCQITGGQLQTVSSP
ncbi:MAG TPA: hypothetical protein VGG27_03765 [Magnetospirillaceae bacterium]|jgi:hypothetical protein